MRAITWTWDEEARWEDICKAVKEAIKESVDPQIIQVWPGGEASAVVVCPVGTTEEEAQKFFDEQLRLLEEELDRNYYKGDKNENT